MGLDPKTKQKLFVDYYLGDAKGNATLAARMAGFSSPRTIGSRLLTKVDIQERIAERLTESAMHSREVLARISGLAKSDMGDFLKFDDFDLDSPPTLDFRKARERYRLGNIRKYKQTTRYIPKGDEAPDKEVMIEVELHDPHKSLGLLAKYHGLTPERFVAEQPKERLVDEEEESIDRMYRETKSKPLRPDGEGGG